MNFRANYLFKPLLPGFLKPTQLIRGVAPRPVMTGSTLSRHDLRRLVAEMVD